MVTGLAFYETILAAGVGEGVIRTNQSPKAREVASGDCLGGLPWGGGLLKPQIDRSMQTQITIEIFLSIQKFFQPLVFGHGWENTEKELYFAFLTCI